MSACASMNAWPIRLPTSTRRLGRAYDAVGEEVQGGKKRIIPSLRHCPGRHVRRPEAALRGLDLVELDFDGYALGGFSVGEPKSVMWEMVDAVIDELPWEKPRYLMGLGFPEDIVEGVSKGIDMFDCVIPTRHARNGNLFTKTGTINIKHAKYSARRGAHRRACGCYTCRHFSRAYLRHLFMARELTSYYLNTVHNLFFYADAAAAHEGGDPRGEVRGVLQGFHVGTGRR